jgi:hypothetical protein
MQKLSQHLSRVILVKARFTAADYPVPFRLGGIESFGLWLEEV